MDFIERVTNHVEVDLENGSMTSGHDTNDELQRDYEILDDKPRIWRGYSGSERLINGEDARRVSPFRNISVGEISGVNLETFPNKWMKEGFKKELVDARDAKRNAKKAAKPPRPPKGPSLDALDMKFAREVSDLARMKHARTERLKMLRQKKADKGSSSFGSIIFAMLITLIFCYVIIFQGLLGSQI